jgi:hypothetical protein
MKWELESVLEQSLTQIAAGKARVESCLLAYPAMADELEPLLRSAETLRTLPKPVLAPEAKARIEDQLLVAAAGNPRLIPVARPRPRLVWPRWRVPRWALNALTLVLALLVAMTAVVGASADALPDSALYPVKLATEEAWLWLTPARNEPGLHLHLARRRLAEIEALAAKGVFDPAVLEAMGEHVEAALGGAAELPPALALPLLEELSDFVGEEHETLSDVQDRAPAGSQVYLDNALLWSLGVIDRVERLRALVEPSGTTESPQPVATDTPASPPALMGVEELGATATVTPTQTAIATASPSPVPTLTWTPTIEPTETATLAPTDEPRAPEPVDTEPPPPPPPTETKPPPPPPTEPPPTEPPPEPTEKVPPGLTKTPQPPGQTKTPQPSGSNANP